MARSLFDSFDQIEGTRDFLDLRDHKDVAEQCGRLYMSSAVSTVSGSTTVVDSNNVFEPYEAGNFVVIDQVAHEIVEVTETPADQQWKDDAVLYIDGSEFTASGEDFNESSNSAKVVTNTDVSKSGSDLVFNGSTSYLQLADSPDWDLSGDFTMDLWINAVDFYTGGPDNRLFAFGNNSAVDALQLIVVASGHQAKIMLNGGHYLLTPGLTEGVWHHLALVRSAGDIYLYLDGTRGDKLTDTTTFTTSLGLIIGRYADGGGEFNGSMRNLRITSKALWTENFNTNDISYTEASYVTVSPAVNVTGDGISCDRHEALKLEDDLNYLRSMVNMVIGENDWKEEPNIDLHRLYDLVPKTKSEAGSWATWNPDDKSSTITLTDSDLTALNNGNAYSGVRATFGKYDGKWFWTYEINGNWEMIGVATEDAALSVEGGTDPGHWCYFPTNDNVYNNNAGTLKSVNVDNGDTLAVALDMDKGYLNFGKVAADGLSVDWWDDPVDGTNPSFDNIPVDGTLIYPFINQYSVSSSITANFGQTDLSALAPEGYTAGIGNHTTTYTPIYSTPPEEDNTDYNVLFIKGNKFIDESPYTHTINNNGVTIVDDSLYFDGSSYLTIPHHDVFNFTDSDFTIEYRFKPTDPLIAKNNIIVEKYGNDPMQMSFNSVYTYARFYRTIFASDEGDFDYFISDVEEPMLVYSHHAIVREGEYYKFFVDGIKKETIHQPAALNTNDFALMIGARRDGVSNLAEGRFVTGYLKGLRLSSKAMYSETFDILANNYDEILTNYLLKMYGSVFEDESENEWEVTNTGVTVVNDAYYFDGTSAYLTMPSSNEYAFTGDFSISFDVNFEVLDTQYDFSTFVSFIGNNVAKTAGGWVFYRLGDGMNIIDNEGNQLYASFTWAIDTWYHVEWAREDGVMKIRVDDNDLTISPTGDFQFQGNDYSQLNLQLGAGANWSAGTWYTNWDPDSLTGYMKNVVIIGS